MTLGRTASMANGRVSPTRISPALSCLDLFTLRHPAHFPSGLRGMASRWTTFAKRGSLGRSEFNPGGQARETARAAREVIRWVELLDLL
jgi:hypothetical protein